ncbi:nitrite reductase (NAD(P)H), partial [Rathayibacter sp. AY2B7]
MLVVGAGPAAHRLVDALVARAGDQALEITVLGEEVHRPYDRVALSKRLDGEHDLTLGDGALWESARLITSSRVVAIDPDRLRVELADGRSLEGDEIVLATGSSATVPPIEGAEHGRVYRTLEDVDGLVAELAAFRARRGRPAIVVVVGGGLLGLEAAGGAHRLGARTALVHSGRWLMSAQLDEGAGQALGRIISAQGIALHLGNRPTAILTSPTGTVLGVALTDGSSISADLVVFSIGITARDELARAVGIEVAPRGGVVVDEACRASRAGVWAIGEVAAIAGRTVGLVAPANAMAEVVADR